MTTDQNQNEWNPLDFVFVSFLDKNGYIVQDFATISAKVSSNQFRVQLINGYWADVFTNEIKQAGKA